MELCRAVQRAQNKWMGTEYRTSHKRDDVTTFPAASVWIYFELENNYTIVMLSAMYPHESAINMSFVSILGAELKILMTWYIFIWRPYYKAIICFVTIVTSTSPAVWEFSRIQLKFKTGVDVYGRSQTQLLWQHGLVPLCFWVNRLCDPHLGHFSR